MTRTVAVTPLFIPFLLTTLLAVAAFPVARAGGSATASAPQAQAPEAGAGTLAPVAFMSGCWAGSFDSESETGTIEEHYTTPSDNLMLGTTRYLLGGRTVMYEFSRLEAVDGEIVLTPFPRGKASEHDFRLTRSADGEAVFEAPEHDFPKRIIYRKDGGDLVARVDNGTDEAASEWSMRPAACH